MVYICSSTSVVDSGTLWSAYKQLPMEHAVQQLRKDYCGMRTGNRSCKFIYKLMCPSWSSSESTVRRKNHVIQLATWSNHGWTTPTHSVNLNEPRVADTTNRRRSFHGELTRRTSHKVARTKERKRVAIKLVMMQTRSNSASVFLNRLRFWVRSIWLFSLFLVWTYDYRAAIKPTND